MRQSRRTNTGIRRNTLARRYRPWLRDDATTEIDGTPQPPAVTVAPRAEPAPIVHDARLIEDNRLDHGP
jgi:hypothetical protein